MEKDTINDWIEDFESCTLASIEFEEEFMME